MEASPEDLGESKADMTEEKLSEGPDETPAPEPKPSSDKPEKVTFKKGDTTPRPESQNSEEPSKH